MAGKEKFKYPRPTKMIRDGEGFVLTEKHVDRHLKRNPALLGFKDQIMAEIDPNYKCSSQKNSSTTSEP